jgi:hypothetical protein
VREQLVSNVEGFATYARVKTPAWPSRASSVATTGAVSGAPERQPVGDRPCLPLEFPGPAQP